MDVREVKAVVLEAVSDLAEVLAVYLFGSVGEGRASRRSDLDLAVLFADDIGPDRRLELRLELRARLASATKGPVDVIPLNGAHPSIAFRAIRGRLLVDRDPVKRSLYVARTISRYHDYRRFLRQHVPSVEARAREGRLGAAR
ncbi:MAG: type VII toxin-antitoxin system MntA family adenylyltransferase antitoxin [Candidatus Binatia bacterium]